MNNIANHLINLS